MGWEALVYTPLNPEIPVEDRSLLDEIPPGTTIIKTPIREPYNFYKRFVGMKSTDRVAANFISDGRKPSFAQKLSVWIRGNFFIPDPRVFWVVPSVRFLKEMLHEDPVDIIVTSGPPHSMLKSDAFRSLVYVLLTAGLLLAFVYKKVDKKLFIVGLLALVLMDMLDWVILEQLTLKI